MKNELDSTRQSNGTTEPLISAGRPLKGNERTQLWTQVTHRATQGER